ncbi:CHAP domain-containing protein [Arcticibacter sp. MXS-1]|uniref:CHAP domain-containing protein n=1 Tax=Arcticibacter sp. MXS-1 TaxID=3341726 RepID=UPI0035A95862
MKTLFIILTGLLAIAGFQKGAEPAAGIRSIYRAEVGVREETGRNDGSRVEEYLRYVGLKKGQPWCASFVCWALGKAGIDNPRSGYCPRLFGRDKVVWERRRGVGELNLASYDGGPVVGKTEAGSDDSAMVFGLYYAEKGRISHVGFVDACDGKYIITVEGNTNEAGSREGDGVYCKRRLLSSVYQIACYKRHSRTALRNPAERRLNALVR